MTAVKGAIQRKQKKQSAAKAKKQIAVAIVGAGSLARVLARELKRSGYRVTEIVGRDQAGSRARAARLARSVAARTATMSSAHLAAGIVWLCVPDDAIRGAAAALAARRDLDWRRKIAVHSSGALPASELSALKTMGASIASVHPMNSFVAESKPSFKGVPIALEGDAKALKTLSPMAKKLNSGGEVFVLKPEQKTLYHAMGAFASPLVIALLDASEEVGKAAGVQRPARVTEIILRTTMENYFRKGAHAAFSGPLRRGDVETIRRHLEELSRLPGARQIYVALAAQAVARLPVKKAAALRSLLTPTD